MHALTRVLVMLARTQVTRESGSSVWHVLDELLRNDAFIDAAGLRALLHRTA
eukprot:CAMPEP_0119167082 /NCGR_PEP_ID=MMETSP1315-20130426/6310_1 /TAXON_ID=676789 /ORGANISM="Prasinoderma singularis, Strain RCC927" /LENGTH=51 /DNA_ID=CAMNT_0007160511 /DNA_START=262 /DNA_END=417 /DNA_ORIENTATION=-